MSTRAAGHEVRVGLVAVVALGGLIGLLMLAGDGPGFLTTRRQIEVDFRDGQGIRPGSPVRIAGIDAGRVTEVTLVEIDSTLKARVTIAVPVDLASKLKQDAKITIQSSLTGQSRINIVSSGRSAVGLVSGQVVQGIETTFFDPILEQVGLGPVERSHLSHTIAEVRDTVDKAGPRIKTILANVADTTTGLKDTVEAVRPSIEGTAGHIEDVARRVNSAAPKVEASLAKLEALTGQVNGILAENRDTVRGTMASVRDLTSTINDIAIKDRVKVEKLIDGLDGTRARIDRVLYQADQIAEQTGQMLARNKTDITRTVSNVRDATDWADKLVQKIFANPFVLSPFYKPTPADIQVQAAYDSAQIFVKGAKELHDAVDTLEAMRARPQTAANRAELDQIEREIAVITNRLGQTSQGLAEALKSPRTGRSMRRE
jgi:phospholipid/cholesterol/gamma-HCH transport system substrate-binding protein